MPRVAGKDASLGLTRNDVPHHTFAGANTFIPRVLPHHPAFGPEVDATALDEGIAYSTAMLRKAATLEASIANGNLTVRVTNESGHKLPTGYPEARRMWLHVRAFDAKRNLLLESGRYVFATAQLQGYDALPPDPAYDPHLQVWEAEMGISPAVAALTGKPAGRSFHLTLNNVRLKDNRIPPRGFSNAAYDAFDGAPLGATYADGQHWDDVVYPVGPDAVRAEVTLYYQTTTREYVEFLRDENTTTAAGNILFDLWDDHGQSEPVAMAQTFVESNDRIVLACQKSASRLQARYRKDHYKEWSRCYERRAQGLSCDATTRDQRIAAGRGKAARAARRTARRGVQRQELDAGDPRAPVGLPGAVLADHAVRHGGPRDLRDLPGGRARRGSARRGVRRAAAGAAGRGARGRAVVPEVARRRREPLRRRPEPGAHRVRARQRDRPQRPAARLRHQPGCEVRERRGARREPRRALRRVHRPLRLRDGRQHGRGPGLHGQHGQRRRPSVRGGCLPMKTARFSSVLRLAALAVGLALLLPGAASARPNYFEAFTTYYGIVAG